MVDGPQTVARRTDENVGSCWLTGVIISGRVCEDVVRSTPDAKTAFHYEHSMSLARISHPVVEEMFFSLIIQCLRPDGQRAGEVSEPGPRSREPVSTASDLPRAGGPDDWLVWVAERREAHRDAQPDGPAGLNQRPLAAAPPGRASRPGHPRVKEDRVVTLECPESHFGVTAHEFSAFWRPKFFHILALRFCSPTDTGARDTWPLIPIPFREVTLLRSRESLDPSSASVTADTGTHHPETRLERK
jgi:hypothetical protein